MTRQQWKLSTSADKSSTKDYIDPTRSLGDNWQEKINRLRQNLGTHKDHQWGIVNRPTGPHAGKVVCNTCDGKFVIWIPKGYISPNT